MARYGQDLQDGSAPRKVSHPVHPVILSKTDLQECTTPWFHQRWEGKTIVIEPVVDAWSDAFLASAGTWDEPIERPGRNECGSQTCAWSEDR